MKRRLVMTMVSAVAASMMVCSPVAVFAGIEEAGQIVDGSELTLSDFVEDTEVVLTRGNFLSNGVARVNNHGNRVVGVSGSTDCHVDCDTVICNLYLEQKNSEGYWYTYDYWNFSTSNDHGLTASTTCDVDGGHWYRARGAHIAILNNQLESISTATNGIWIE